MAETVWYCLNCGYETTSSGRCHSCEEQLLASPLAALPPLGESYEIGYPIAGWDNATRGNLIQALMAAGIVHRFDDDELVVLASDEPRLDVIMTEASPPVVPETGPDAEFVDDDGSPRRNWLIVAAILIVGALGGYGLYQGEQAVFANRSNSAAFPTAAQVKQAMAENTRCNATGIVPLQALPCQPVLPPSSAPKHNSSIIVRVDFTDLYYVGGAPGGPTPPAADSSCHYVPDSGVGPTSEVLVTDGSGSVLGEANLSQQNGYPQGVMDSSDTGCEYTFDVGRVKKVSQYGISIGSLTPVYYSLTEMQADDWQVSIDVS